MYEIRINPFVVTDLKEIKEYIAEDNPIKAAETIEKIYDEFERLRIFPDMGQTFLRE